jgi:hypothetical protein
MSHNEDGSGQSANHWQEVLRMGVDRFGTLLYGIGEAAGYLAVPPSTLTTWTYGYERQRAGARGGTEVEDAIRVATRAAA